MSVQFAGITTDNAPMLYDWICVAPYVLVAAVDFTVEALAAQTWRRDSARYYRLHCLWNLMLTALTWPEFAQLALSANPALDGTAAASGRTVLAMHGVMALYVYHALAWKMTSSDVLHHTTSVFVAIPLLLTIKTRVIASHIFVGCGLPGALDYGVMVALKHNFIARRQQKKMTELLNFALRAPLGSIVAYWTLLTAPKDAYLASVVIGALTYWNVNYFARESARSAALNS